LTFSPASSVGDLKLGMGDSKGLSYCQDVCLKERGCVIALLIRSCVLEGRQLRNMGGEGVACEYGLDSLDVLLDLCG
jgi:hypothetical protein